MLQVLGFWLLPLVLSPVGTRGWAFRRLSYSFGKVGGLQDQLMVSHLQLFLVPSSPAPLPIMTHKDRGTCCVFQGAVEMGRGRFWAAWGPQICL